MFERYNNSYYEYYCNYLFPMAIEYGMSADEFWKDDPQLFVSYRTSFVNRQQREMEKMDYDSWLKGLYVYDGNSKLTAILKQTISNLGAKQPHYDKVDTYPKKPYTEIDRDKNKKTEEKTDYKNYQNSLIYFGSIKQIYLDKKINQKGE